jgi:hypothetical protein
MLLHCNTYRAAKAASHHLPEAPQFGRSPRGTRQLFMANKTIIRFICCVCKAEPGTGLGLGSGG